MIIIHIQRERGRERGREREKKNYPIKRQSNAFIECHTIQTAHRKRVQVTKKVHFTMVNEKLILKYNGILLRHIHHENNE